VIDQVGREGGNNLRLVVWKEEYGKEIPMVVTRDLQKNDDGCHAIYTDYAHPMDIVEQAVADHKSLFDGRIPRTLILQSSHKAAMQGAVGLTIDGQEVRIEYSPTLFTHVAMCYTEQHYMVTMFRTLERRETIRADTLEEAQKKGLEKLSGLQENDFREPGDRGVKVDGEVTYGTGPLSAPLVSRAETA
jgi:hypothetical protein